MEHDKIKIVEHEDSFKKIFVNGVEIKNITGYSFNDTRSANCKDKELAIKIMSPDIEYVKEDDESIGKMEANINFDSKKIANAVAETILKTLNK